MPFWSFGDPLALPCSPDPIVRQLPAGPKGTTGGGGGGVKFWVYGCSKGAIRRGGTRLK